MTIDEAQSTELILEFNNYSDKHRIKAIIDHRDKAEILIRIDLYRVSSISSTPTYIHLGYRNIRRDEIVMARHHINGKIIRGSILKIWIDGTISKDDESRHKISIETALNGPVFTLPLTMVLNQIGKDMLTGNLEKPKFTEPSRLEVELHQDQNPIWGSW
jgi:hypothetical protein